MESQNNNIGPILEEEFEPKQKISITMNLEKEYVDFLDLVHKNRSEAIRLIIKKFQKDIYNRSRKEMLQLAAVGFLLLAVSFILVSVIGYIFMGISIIIISYSVWNIVKKVKMI
jgi:hypothetical protein